MLHSVYCIRYASSMFNSLYLSFADEKSSNEVPLYEVIDQTEDIQHFEYYESDQEDYYYNEDQDAYEDLKKKNKKKKKKKEKLNPYKIEFVTQEPQDRVTYAFDFKNEISKFSRSKFNSNGQIQKPENPFKTDNSVLRISSPLLTFALMYIF